MFFRLFANFSRPDGIYFLALLDNGEMMKKSLVLSLFILCILSTVTFGQSVGITKKDLSQAEIDRIIKTATTNERLFRQALNVYAFNRYATIQTIGLGGQITGTYRRDSFLTFNEAGERYEKILFAPISTLTEITISAADIDNLGGIDPFAIEPKVADQYNFTFLGKEHIDELDLFVFDVEPKIVPDAKKGIAKFFSGRIWIDDKDLLIVKSKGKAVPEGKERFPVMETWRENIDGKYWFPTLSIADSELVFDKGQVVKMKVRVHYKDYKVGRSEVRILDDEPDKPTPTPTPKKP